MHGTGVAKRWRCSDALWAFVAPLLPVHENRDPRGRGRPRREDRDAFDGILFVLQTGSQWNALNATGICTSSTAHRRFQEWLGAGVFLNLWKSGLDVYDELKGLKWNWQSMDGAMTKAPLGGEKDWAKPHGSGQIRNEAKHSGGGRRRADWTGGGRSERQRLQVGARDR